MSDRGERRRLPLAAQRPRANTRPRAAERVAAPCPVLCVLDEAAPDAALRFACGVVERLRARGCGATAWMPANALHAAAALRLRGLGVTVSALAEPVTPAAALSGLGELPRDRLAIAFGAPLASALSALLTVRAGARPGMLPSDVECDLEFAHDDGVLATLIGDWLALHVTAVSAEDRAALEKTPQP